MRRRRRRRRRRGRGISLPLRYFNDTLLCLAYGSAPHVQPPSPLPPLPLLLPLLLLLLILAPGTLTALFPATTTPPLRSLTCRRSCTPSSTPSHRPLGAGCTLTDTVNSLKPAEEEEERGGRGRRWLLAGRGASFTSATSTRPSPQSRTYSTCSLSAAAWRALSSSTPTPAKR